MIVININQKQRSLKGTAYISFLFFEIGHGRATVSMQTAFKIYNLMKQLAKITELVEKRWI